MSGIKFAAAALLLTGFMAGAGEASGADLSLVVTGNMVGSVTDARGVPQIGATVQLLNRYERVVSKAITANDGRFIFAGLPYDSYAVRVSQPSFLPAFRDEILVKPGEDSYLQIHMATLFSSIQVSYRIPAGTMTNDWKWVLRTSQSTRPVTRFLPGLASKKKDENGNRRPQIFSNTHAMVRLNGGDSGFLDNNSALYDMGSIFALSTDLYGKNQFQVAGSLGQSGVELTPPAARGFAAVYQRRSDDESFPTPQVSLAETQLSRFGPPVSGPGQPPLLRLMSMSLYQVSDPIGALHLEYGGSLQSVSFLQESGRISPFARATLSLTPASRLIAAYSDGTRPDELIEHSSAFDQTAMTPGSETQNVSSALNALGRLPQMTNRDGRLVLQRTQNYEVGYSRDIGSRTFAVSGFREQVWDGQMTVSGNMALVNPANLLFDGASKTAVYDIGDYSRVGYVGSVTQKITSNLDFGVGFGQMGGFAPQTLGHSFDYAQPSFHTGLYDVAGAKLRASIPISHTRLTAGYGWMESNAIVPTHMFLTQSNMISPGLSFGFEQPIPAPFGFPGHLVLTADLRNLLAQGYIPMGGGANELLAVQSPRAIRGGLNLTF